MDSSKKRSCSIVILHLHYSAQSFHNVLKVMKNNSSSSESISLKILLKGKKTEGPFTSMLFLVNSQGKNIKISLIINSY